MSKFWLSGHASESSESDSEASSVASSVEDKKKPDTKNWNDFEDSSSEEEKRRIVRSEKDKKWSSLRDIVTHMQQNQRVQDYVGVMDDFESLQKVLTKAQPIIDKEGPPAFLIRALVQLERYVEEKHRDKATLKKASKLKATAINRLQRAIPKACDQFRDKMNECKESPSHFASDDDNEMSSSSDESSSDESDDEAPPPPKKSAKAKPVSDSESESSSSNSDEDSDDESGSSSDSDSDSDSESSGSASSSSESEESSASSSSSSSESDVASSESEGDFESKHARAMRKWGLKTTTVDEEAKKEAKRLAATKRREDAEKRKAAKDKTREDALLRPVEPRRSSLLLPEAEMLDEAGLLTKVREITADRNKRGAERLEQIDLLRRLCELAHQKHYAQLEIDILGFLTTFGLDSVQASGLHPTTAAWESIYNDLMTMLFLLSSQPNARLRLAAETVDTDRELQTTAAMITSFIDRLDDHLLRSLQGSDAHTQEYLDRLVHDMHMTALLWVTYSWLSNQAQELQESWRTALRLVEHLYYLHDRLAVRKWAIVQKALSEKFDATHYLACPMETPSHCVEELCSQIFAKTPTSETRVLLRAQICLAYSYAIHDKFHQAKDIFSGGHLYDIAMSLDINEQVLYNRGLAQVGLAAFRKGLIQIASSCLGDICSANKQRELLAQGVAVVKGFEKTVEQEKAERRRLLPAHLHINLDLLESAYNICAMLIEVPTMCNPNLETRQRQSRFKRALEIYDKTSTLPESSREFVMTAAKCLQTGEWKKCEDHIFGLKFWQYLQPETSRQRVQEIISEKIKCAALRSYVLSYSHRYHSMGVEQMSTLFALPTSTVYSLVSKMMITKELSAFWDAGSRAILITKTTPTRLQLGALNVCDGVAQSVEQFEQVFQSQGDRANPQQARRTQRARA